MNERAYMEKLAAVHVPERPSAYRSTLARHGQKSLKQHFTNWRPSTSKLKLRTWAA